MNASLFTLNSDKSSCQVTSEQEILSFAKSKGFDMDELDIRMNLVIGRKGNEYTPLGRLEDIESVIAPNGCQNVDNLL